MAMCNSASWRSVTGVLKPRAQLVHAVGALALHLVEPVVASVRALDEEAELHRQNL